MHADASLLLLDRDATRALLKPDEVLAAVREAFALHASGAGQLYPVVREALPAGVFCIKSGTVASDDLLGLKAAGFWAGNRTIGADGHQATIILFDPSTGRPRCIVDGNAVTTERTAAAGALGLQMVARQDSRRLCVFGTGVQGKAQVDYALRMLPALEHVVYRTSDGRRDLEFEACFAGRCHVAPAASANDAVAGSDVIVTATTGRAPLFDAAAVSPGTHINAVGADTRGKRELPVGLLARALVWADDLAQARTLGELQWAAPDFPAAELGSLLSSPMPREAAAITVFDMTGTALQDLSVARMLYRQAQALSAGTVVPWPW